MSGLVMAPMGDNITIYGNWASSSTYTVDNTSDTMWWGTDNRTRVTSPQVNVTYAPLPPVPEDEADADMRWLKRRVREMEEYSRLAA